MSKKCTDCENELPKNGLFVTCFGGCGAKLHFKCSGIKEELWKGMGVKRKRDWRCKRCRKGGERREIVNDSSTDDDEDEENAKKGSIEGMSTVSTVKLEMCLKDLEGRLSDAITSLEFLMQENDDMKRENKKMKGELKKRKGEIQEIRNIEENTKKMTEEAKATAMKQGQYDRNKNVEICGLLQKEGENLENLINVIAIELKVDGFKSDDVEIAHRVTTRAGQGRKQGQKEGRRPNNVVIQFKERKKRDKWIEKRKCVIVNNKIASNPP